MDLPTIDPARRHPRLALRVLQALARNIGMDYGVTRVVRDVSTDDSEIARSTVYDYLAPLERLMVLDPLEALVVRDLRVFADVVDGTVQHYRDSNDLEIDAVVTAGDGRWAAFEVKLGHDDIDTAAANLLTFARTFDTTKVGEPAALGVVTTTGYGYTRPDGVVVIPAATLGP